MKGRVKGRHGGRGLGVASAGGPSSPRQHLPAPCQPCCQVTSPYYYNNINGFSYVIVEDQHPYGEGKGQQRRSPVRLAAGAAAAALLQAPPPPPPLRSASVSLVWMHGERLQVTACTHVHMPAAPAHTS